MKDLITKYEKENQDLKNENIQLKQKLSQFEGYLVIPKDSKMGIAKTAGISLFVIMALVSLPAFRFVELFTIDRSLANGIKC